MKRIALLFAILYVQLSTFSFVFAQYEETKVQRTAQNRPYAEIPMLSSEAAHAPSLGGSREKLFNFDWRFQLGNPEGAEREQFDDAGWRKLDLPHDYQFEQPWDEKAGGARGWKGQC